MRNVLLGLGFCAAVGVLGGCQKAQETLGLSRVEPDEFSVVDRKPLSVPPGYGLKPPVPGQKSAVERTPSDDAQQALLKGTKSPVQKSATRSGAEAEMLRKAQGDAKANETQQKLLQIEERSEGGARKAQSFFGETSKSKDVINPEEENLKYNGSRKPVGKTQSRSQEAAN